MEIRSASHHKIFPLKNWKKYYFFPPEKTKQSKTRGNMTQHRVD
jgi:hypothetical protein